MAESCFMSVCLCLAEVDVCPNGRMLLYVSCLSMVEVDVCSRPLLRDRRGPSVPLCTQTCHICMQPSHYKTTNPLCQHIIHKHTQI